MLAKLFLLIHVAGGLCMVAVVACQLGVHGRLISLAQLGKLLSLETIYSWSTLLTLISGLSLWVLQAVPGNAFSDSFFVAKLSLFLLAAISSVYPSMVLLRLRDGPLEPKIPLPMLLTLTMSIEIVALLGIVVMSSAPRFA